MDIAAFIIGGILIGFVVGMIYTLSSVSQVVDDYRAEAERWCTLAIENLQRLLAEKTKHKEEREDDDADWWKK